MKSHLTQLTYEIELQPGEKMALPESFTNTVSEGRWQITIKPLPANGDSIPTRDHSAFLHSYAPSDEGLYDDNPTG